MKQLFPLLKGARLGSRVNPPSSEGAGRALHLEIPSSAGGRAKIQTPQCAAYRSSGSQFSAKTVSLNSGDGRGAFPSAVCGGKRSASSRWIGGNMWPPIQSFSSLIQQDRISQRVALLRREN